MKKFVWFAVAAIAIYIAGLQVTKDDSPAQALDVPSRAPVTITATPRPTEVPLPTATIDYLETALVAQSTADEARRVNAQATAAHESVLLAQSQLTAQAELIALSQLQLTAIVEGMTATAAYTSVPLTATQQVYANTAIAERQRLQVAQLTATSHAPTQMVAIERAKNYVTYGKADYFVRWFGILFVCVFVVGVVVFMFRYPMQPTSAPEEQTETVIWLRNRKDAGAKSTRYAVPCSPEQLTELSELVVNGERTFGINRLENNSRTLRRGTLYQVREFLTVNGFAVDAGAGQIALNDEGEEFLVAWFEEHRLREGYKFADDLPSKSEQTEVAEAA